MTETLNELAESFKKEHPEITLTFNFDSSGTLKTQIVEGADCDLFISAAQKQMNELDKTADAEKNPDGADYIDPDTRINLLENKVALCVTEGNPKEIRSYDELAMMLQDKDILLAIGNADVPVGQYTQKIFEYYNLDEESIAEAGKLTYGSNVKEVTTQVSEGSVDCGIIYQTDAYSANLDIVDTATEEMCGQVIYPAAVLKNSKNADGAKLFLEYLQTEKADEVFSKVGFTPV
jgi:molybdate transport system substrate-binding protein